MSGLLDILPYTTTNEEINSKSPANRTITWLKPDMPSGNLVANLADSEAPKDETFVAPDIKNINRNIIIAINVVFFI
jgi:hypothetical protein|tara:strand:- start:47935 stop:48165 length:231 start_codon:yes stop_codon:yes gene_type:complete